jgi:uncharacterized protein with von Willebrand factor type A (vWA) domain
VGETSSKTLDLPAFAAAFGRRLRAAGLGVTPERSARFARSLALLAPLTRERVEWAGRAAFTSSREEGETYARVFAQVFDGLSDPADARGEHGSVATSAGREAPGPARRSEGRRSAAPPGALSPRWARAGLAGDADADGQEGVLAAASAQERLTAKLFAELDPEELAEVRRRMAALRVAAPERRTRRARRARHGHRPDQRRTLRRSLHTGGDPVRYARRARRMRRRRLVMLLDVSGSMEPYARAFLQFLESAVGGARAEAFVFSTRLTRVTRALAGGHPQAAIQRALAAAPDWSGGTRLADALKQFNDGYGRRGLARGAVVVIVSDGLESGDPAAVGREMARLRRLAWRIVWVNPRAASPAFAPLAGGMAAALPHCDAFVSGHSLDALDAVVEAIGAES